MTRAAWTEDGINRWSYAASALLHILIAVFILRLPIAPESPDQTEGNLEVELVTLPPAQADLAKQREQPAEPPPARREGAAPPDRIETAPKSPTIPAPVPAEALPHDETPTMVKPSRMLSEAVLAAPQSRKARDKLAMLAPDERVAQICDVEAMAQVGAWSKELKPDRVVAYAMADANLSANSFTADGAALHSKGDWYRLRFKCDLTPDRKKVAGFKFLLGDPIPKKDWADHSLPTEIGSLD
jgi:hypothetical protein